jgi:hypothetical protein
MNLNNNLFVNEISVLSAMLTVFVLFAGTTSLDKQALLQVQHFGPQKCHWC